MARVNVGVNPRYISDQHLIAESVEIIMITGGLKHQNFKIKSKIPDIFNLGTGHINFFKNKILYLKKRLDEVNKELLRRDFHPSTNINLSEYPIELINDWKPDLKSTEIIRKRIIERLLNPKSGVDGKVFHKYCRKSIGPDMNNFIERIKNSEINFV